MLPSMYHVLQALDPSADVPEPDDSPRWRKMRCVSPDHPDGNRSATVNYHVRGSDGEHYQCWSCRLKGNSLDVIMGALHLDLEAAYNWARNEVGWRGGKSQGPSPVSSKPGKKERWKPMAWRLEDGDD